MLGLQHILLEGRVEDAREYLESFIDENGYLKTEEDLDEVLGYFVKGDPSGNNKYLMWMAKIYANDSGFSPNMLIDLVQRFHNNLDKIHPALILQQDGEIYSDSRIETSPKNIDSYPDYRSLKGVVEASEEVVTRKQKETEAKAGVDKLYEDERWLLVKPNTYEGSCYYGSSTKWCTAAKDNTTHFQDYSKRGNLYYIIDKSHELGDFYKIALFKEWDGKEEWYDRADDELNQGTINAIRSMLPQDLIIALDYSHDEMEEPEKEADLLTLDEFREKLVEYVKTDKKLQKISTNSGVWSLHIDETDGVWTWYSTPTSNQEDIVPLHLQSFAVQATPFWDGRNEIPFDFVNDDNDYPDWGFTAGPEYMESTNISQDTYLQRTTDNMWQGGDWAAAVFLNQIYFPLLRKS